MGCISLKTKEKPKDSETIRNLETCPEESAERNSLKLMPIASPQFSLNQSLRLSEEDFNVYSLEYLESETFLLEYNTSKHSIEKTSLEVSLYPESGCVYLKSGILMFAGGIDISSHHEVKNVFFIYPDYKEIVEACPMPFVKRRLRLLQVEHDVFAIGGVKELKIRSHNTYTLKQDYGNSFLRYSITENCWKVLENLPTGVEFPGCFSLDTKILVTGGCFLQNSSEVADIIQVYDLHLDTWEVLCIKLPFPLYGHVCEALEDGSVLVFGGVNIESQSNLVCLKYHEGCFTELNRMPEDFELFFPFYGCSNKGEVYSFNEDNELFMLNLKLSTWTASKVFSGN